ncbi:hypothetical protein [Bradyrhizobium manausense]|uniref:Uncharacterized protein n=1 Tax=Bradyrhizobium manausense TaxID=989370 RepID=A0A0R3DQW7_9BRAD|nr:hypothetical protein [Bradyrhizobium manausense]KRQ09311.1 hypothetical protein AOQ71_20830 [Bradyrhizobium manausense]
MRKMIQGIAAFLAIAVASPAFAQGSMRYELFPEPDVRSNTTYRTATAYVVDKKENQFWICSARYGYHDLTANNGSCVKLAATVGRPSLNENYVAHAVTGSAMINPFFPVIWFIDPNGGDVQFCDIRHAGLCVKIDLQP